MQGASPPAAPTALIVSGVSGSGKTTVGQTLAAAVGAVFLEGDDYHPAANVALMRAGHALSDAERWPWLAALGSAIADQAKAGRQAVVSCSALKRAYRERLAADAGCPLTILQLVAEAHDLDGRLRERHGHFMPATLLGSQLDALEPLGADEPGTTIAATGTVAETVAAIRRWLATRPAGNAAVSGA